MVDLHNDLSLMRLILSDMKETEFGCDSVDSMIKAYEEFEFASGFVSTLKDISNSCTINRNLSSHISDPIKKDLNELRDSLAKKIHDDCESLEDIVDKIEERLEHRTLHDIKILMEEAKSKNYTHYSDFLDMIATYVQEKGMDESDYVENVRLLNVNNRKVFIDKDRMKKLVYDIEYPKLSIAGVKEGINLLAEAVMDKITAIVKKDVPKTNLTLASKTLSELHTLMDFEIDEKIEDIETLIDLVEHTEYVPDQLERVSKLLPVVRYLNIGIVHLSLIDEVLKAVNYGNIIRR